MSRGVFGHRLFTLAQLGVVRIDCCWGRLRRLPAQTLNVILEDPPDNRILECAVEAGSEYILTWDKDLLRLGEYQGIKMIRPVDFLQPGLER